MTVPISVTVNGRSCQADVEPRLLLVDFLREELGLTGTHVGCDTSGCGACTILVNAEHGLQCGVCTPGMIMTAKQLLDRNPDPSDTEIRHALEGNFCRCTGYENIVRSVRSAAGKSA